MDAPSVIVTLSRHCSTKNTLPRSLSLVVLVVHCRCALRFLVVLVVHCRCALRSSCRPCCALPLCTTVFLSSLLCTAVVHYGLLSSLLCTAGAHYGLSSSLLCTAGMHYPCGDLGLIGLSVTFLPEVFVTVRFELWRRSLMTS